MKHEFFLDSYIDMLKQGKHAYHPGYTNGMIYDPEKIIDTYTSIPVEYTDSFEKISKKFLSKVGIKTRITQDYEPRRTQFFSGFEFDKVVPFKVQLHSSNMEFAEFSVIDKKCTFDFIPVLDCVYSRFIFRFYDENGNELTDFDCYVIYGLCDDNVSLTFQRYFGGKCIELICNGKTLKVCISGGMFFIKENE